MCLSILGVLAGVWPCGVICIVSELFVSESLSQVYGILHEFLEQNSSLTSIGALLSTYANTCGSKVHALSILRPYLLR